MKGTDVQELLFNHLPNYGIILEAFFNQMFDTDSLANFSLYTDTQVKNLKENKKKF